ncbi:MAG: flippase-like domain-containing protein [Acidobacteria bacterium]|nr:flippase-like domain-containing protein [Acidobacteriota bacterium]
MKKRLIILAKVLVTTFLIIYLFQTKGIDLERSWIFIRNSHWGYIVLAGLLLFVGQFICTARWSGILEHLGIHIRLWRLFQFYMIGMFFSLFFPSVIGGDFVKIYYVKRDSGKSLTLALASIYLERAAGFLALLVYGLAGALIYPISLRPVDFRPLGWLGIRELPLWILPALLLLGFILANWVLFGSRLYNYAVKLFNLLKLERFAEKILLLRDAMTSFRHHPAALNIPVLLSFLNIGLVIVMNWLVALALDIDISMIVLAAIVSLMTVMVMLPISINGIGLRENAYVVLLSLVNVDPDKSFALSVIGFVLIILTGMPGGVCYSLLKKEIPVDLKGDLLPESEAV